MNEVYPRIPLSVKLKRIPITFIILVVTFFSSFYCERLVEISLSKNHKNNFYKGRNYGKQIKSLQSEIPTANKNNMYKDSTTEFPRRIEMIQDNISTDAKILNEKEYSQYKKEKLRDNGIEINSDQLAKNTKDKLSNHQLKAEENQKEANNKPSNNALDSKLDVNSFNENKIKPLKEKLEAVSNGEINLKKTNNKQEEKNSKNSNSKNKSKEKKKTFMEGFITSFSLNYFAELGDKSFLLIITLYNNFDSAIGLLFICLFGQLTMTLISVILGNSFSNIMTSGITKIFYIVGFVLFTAYGISFLYDYISLLNEEEENSIVPENTKEEKNTTTEIKFEDNTDSQNNSSPIKNICEIAGGIQEHSNNKNNEEQCILNVDNHINTIGLCIHCREQNTLKSNNNNTNNDHLSEETKDSKTVTTIQRTDNNINSCVCQKKKKLREDEHNISTISYKIIKSLKTENKESTCSKYVKLYGFIFLAEFGDRSSITTIILSTKYNPVSIFIGNIFAHFFGIVSALFIGFLLKTNINLNLLKLLSAIVFFAFAIEMAYNYFNNNLGEKNFVY